MGCVWLDVGDLVVWTRTHRFIFCFTFLSPVWLTTQNHSTLVTERSAVPFLPVNPEYSATRNQVNTHILVYVCNDWFKGTDRGEGKKDKMEISYFLDGQFMCLLGGGRERSVKLAAAVPQLWECNLSALSLYLSSSPCEVESEISSPLTKFIVICMAHFWCKHSNPSVHTHIQTTPTWPRLLSRDWAVHCGQRLLFMVENRRNRIFRVELLWMVLHFGRSWPSCALMQMPGR